MSNKVLFNAKYNRWVNNTLSAFGKVGNNKHLSALRDGFAMLTPLMIAGALGVVFIVFIFGGWGSNNASFLGIIARIQMGVSGAAYTTAGSTKIYADLGFMVDANDILTFLPDSTYAEVSNIGSTIFGPLWSATIGGALSIYTAFAIGYFYSRGKNTNQPIIAGLVSLASFFVLTSFDTSLFGPNGSLISIITAFAAIEVYCALEKSKRLLIKMPDGVPPAVAVSFSKVFPIMILLGGLVLLNAPFVIFNNTLGTTGVSLGHAIYTGIQAPFETLAADPSGQLGIGLLFITLVGFFWFFGLHGSNILDGAVNPIWFVLLALNTSALANGQEATQAMSKGFFDAYVYIGGTGATLSLLIGTLLFSRRRDTREIAKFSIPAGLFQINEPVTFGFPMVLNTTFFVPYVFTMPTLATIAWLCISILHIVPGGIVPIPWSTPMILGAFLHTGSWEACILAIFNICVAFVIYLPFIFIYNKQAIKQGVAPTQSWVDKITQFNKRFELSADIVDIKAQIKQSKQDIKDANADASLDLNARTAKVNEINSNITSLQGKIGGIVEINKKYVTDLKSGIRTAKANIDKVAMKAEIARMKDASKAKQAEINKQFDPQIARINDAIVCGYDLTPAQAAQVKSKIANLKAQYNVDAANLKAAFDTEKAKATGNEATFVKQNYDAKLADLGNKYLNDVAKVEDGKRLDVATADLLRMNMEQLIQEKDAASAQLKVEIENQADLIKAKYESKYLELSGKYTTYVEEGVRA